MLNAPSGPFLGVIGGMGPAATADFLAKLVQARGATRDQDNIPILVWGDCRIPDRTVALGKDRASVAAPLASAARSLVALGAVALVIPCNTAHAWATEIEAATSLRLLHIADAVVEHVRHLDVPRVGLLATTGTLAAKLYELRFSRASIDCTTPNENEQESVMQAIALVKAGRLDTARRLAREVLNALRARGAARTILACTELPLILADEADVVDTTRCLADYATAWWMAKYDHAPAPG
ncbi:MAG TPA: amino acid racemase [Rhizomicrobium sp.]